MAEQHAGIAGALRHAQAVPDSRHEAENRAQQARDVEAGKADQLKADGIFTEMVKRHVIVLLREFAAERVLVNQLDRDALASFRQSCADLAALMGWR